MIPVPEGLRTAMMRHGLTPPQMIEPERFRRFPGADKDRHNTAGWLKVRANGSAVYGDLSRDLSESWQPQSDRLLTRSELDALKREAAEHRAQAEADKKAAEERTATRARALWTDAARAAHDHAYLRRKCINAHGTGQQGRTLAVPMFDPADWSVWNIQWIGPDGTKRFMKDGRTKGLCYMLDGIEPKSDGVLLIAEGFATAASCREATGYPTTCAFTAGNLQPVAKAMRARYPKAKVIVCGDNDESNTGQLAAEEAARAVRGLVAIPPTAGRDWNDVHQAEGLDVVRGGIETASAPEPSRGNGQDAVDRTAGLEPTPLIRPTPPPAPYPLDALGPVLGPAARAIVEIVQVPDALAAGCVLATAALAGQSHANVQTLGGARPLSLFMLTIAQSGDRKTAADNVALAPVYEHTKRMHTAYKAAMEEWELAQEARKLERAVARKKASKAQSGDEYPEALKEIGGEPKPRMPWLVCTEPTAEGLVRSLADGLFAQGIYTDEGGQFLGGHALSEEAELRTIAMLSRIWQGAPLDRVRATDHEHLVLYGRRVSMHLLVQPDVATRMLGKPLYRSQGFLARWLIAAPESLAGTRLHDSSRPEPSDDPHIRKFWHAVEELLARPTNEDPELGGLSPRCLALSPEARALLISAYDEMELAQGEDGELEAIREWASKSAEHACRIAGVLTLIADPEAEAVTVEAMRGALTVMEFHMSEYMRMIGSADVPENIQRATLLLEWLRTKRHKAVTARQVTQYGPGRAIRHAGAAKEALRTLAEYGWLLSEDRGTYVVHPATFAEGGCHMSFKLKCLGGPANTEAAARATATVARTATDRRHAVSVTKSGAATVAVVAVAPPAAHPHTTVLPGACTTCPNFRTRQAPDGWCTRYKVETWRAHPSGCPDDWRAADPKAHELERRRSEVAERLRAEPGLRYSFHVADAIPVGPAALPVSIMLAIRTMAGHIVTGEMHIPADRWPGLAVFIAHWQYAAERRPS